jgi:hypothetical protein
MKQLLPIAIFIVVAFVLQGVNLGISIAVEQMLSEGGSVAVFALFYIGAFWVAWKITVWLVDAKLNLSRS